MRYVFFTGMGRSGTKFLTSLLAKSPGVQTTHEYIGSREFWLLSWYLPADVYTIPYLERAKRKIESEFNDQLFIDVNGYLQNSSEHLHTVFNPVKVFHFVRNPKSVVRSYFTRRNDKDIHLVPKDRINAEKWMDNDKFFQICWNWASTTEILLNQKTELIQFEKVTSDYNYFQQRILEPLQLHISKELWQEGVSTKVNRTRSAAYRWLYSLFKGKPYTTDELPEYNLWTEKQKQVFADVCGPAMRKCGYEI